MLVPQVWIERHHPDESLDGRQVSRSFGTASHRLHITNYHNKSLGCFKQAFTCERSIGVHNPDHPVTRWSASTCARHLKCRYVRVRDAHEFPDLFEWPVTEFCYSYNNIDPTMAVGRHGSS
jgi:hypothetical protein